MARSPVSFPNGEAAIYLAVAAFPPALEETSLPGGRSPDTSCGAIPSRTAANPCMQLPLRWTCKIKLRGRPGRVSPPRRSPTGWKRQLPPSPGSLSTRSGTSLSQWTSPSTVLSVADQPLCSRAPPVSVRPRALVLIPNHQTDFRSGRLS
jgi:hypothetical protein